MLELVARLDELEDPPGPRRGISGHGDVVGTVGPDLVPVVEPGEQVLGGGFDITPRTSVGDQPNVIVLDSRPSGPSGAVPTDDAPATGWYVDARRNSGNAAASVDVFVICGS